MIQCHIQTTRVLDYVCEQGDWLGLHRCLLINLIPPYRQLGTWNFSIYVCRCNVILYYTITSNDREVLKTIICGVHLLLSCVISMCNSCSCLDCSFVLH